MKSILTIIFTLSLFYLSFGQKPKEDFNLFFFQFATEKEFQLERIKFPLEFVTWKNEDEAGGEILITRIKKEEWQHDYFFMNENYRPQIFDNFKGELNDTDERLFQWIGTETGVDVKYFFKRIDGEWFLIKKENLGD